ncbi:MAG: hypothetical protein KBE23_19620 [Chloroflexi bacterium]|nr:hypothetical protein [Chloroflexota bacterium]MBP7044970.1 hypothetical protein [Chloroflexota bacterium]
MIRPFTLRDLTLVYRLSEYAVSLHTESALTHNSHPVRDALVSMVSGDYPTLVWKSDGRNVSGFIQLQVREESPHAHVFYVGATPAGVTAAEGADVAAKGENGDETAVSPAMHTVHSDPPDRHGNQAAQNETVWLALLDQAVVEMGNRGKHSLVAEVSEIGYELPILRRAGFAVYTRQDIWVLENGTRNPPPQTAVLSQRQPTDDWDIQLLYANTVPRLVQMVETLPPLTNGESWVLREEGEVTAFVHIQKGPLASWLRLLIHPDAESRVDEIVAAALHIAKPAIACPVFCCVRRYQSWLQGPLNRAGFSLWGSQAVMVRHTVKHQRKPLEEPTAVLEAQGIPASAPMVQPYRRLKHNGKTSVHDRTRTKTS